MSESNLTKAGKGDSLTAKGRDMTDNKLTKGDLSSMFWRSWFILGSYNFERMQSMGFCVSMIPAIKRFYKTKDEQSAALKRHLEFFNTTPYMAAPIMGITAAMEEQRSNGAPIDDAAISGVKIGLIGPLAGVGDPIFWGTLRPMFAALGASVALSGSVLGPLLFFIPFNICRIITLWFGLHLGYEKGTEIVTDASGNTLQKLTEGASIVGLFIMGVLVCKWTTINVPLVIAKYKGMDGKMVTTTVQSVLDSFVPGLLGLLMTFGCMKLLKKKVNPMTIIFGMFALGIIGYVCGFLG
jgi:PTS system mannose-specific IID component